MISTVCTGNASKRPTQEAIESGQETKRIKVSLTPLTQNENGGIISFLEGLKIYRSEPLVKLLNETGFEKSADKGVCVKKAIEKVSETDIGEAPCLIRDLIVLSAYCVHQSPEDFEQDVRSIVKKASEALKVLKLNVNAILVHHLTFATVIVANSSHSGEIRKLSGNISPAIDNKNLQDQYLKKWLYKSLSDHLFKAINPGDGAIKHHLDRFIEGIGMSSQKTREDLLSLVQGTKKETREMIKSALTQNVLNTLNIIETELKKRELAEDVEAVTEKAAQDVIECVSAQDLQIYLDAHPTDNLAEEIKLQ